MADKINQIKLPNGTTYDIEDANTAISSSYTAATKTVVLTVGSLTDADDTEY